MENKKIVDWSKHELIVRKYKSDDGQIISEYTLKKPDTWLNSVIFCNHNNVCSVSGDYSNWIFDRVWNPENPDTSLTHSYWYEKLRITSVQKFETDVEKCVEYYLETRDEYRKENPEWFDEESPEYDEDLVEFFEKMEEIDTSIDSEYWCLINDYWSILQLDEPYQVPKYPAHFYIIIEAFEEMMNRLKKEKLNK